MSGWSPSPPPLVSVIMPCCNAASFVAEAITSVMDQTYGNVELVVVDDGSVDGSRDVVGRLKAEHDWRITLLHADRIGPYPARNLGLTRARGSYVAFLDADDWWVPDCLQKLERTLDGYDAEIVYCGWQNVGHGITSAPYVPPAYEEDDPVAQFLRTCPWPIHAALLRRELVNRLGGFSTRRYSSMDYDFWLRALALTRHMKRVPEVLAYYRWHDQGQVSAVKWRQVFDALDAQREFIANNPGLVAHFSPSQLKDLTEGQVLRQAYRAFWKRDLVSAQKLFRHAAASGSYRIGDIRHIVSALLPMALYRSLTRLSDRLDA